MEHDYRTMWKYLKFFDNLLGCYTLQNKNTKLTFQQKLRRGIHVLFFINFVLLLLYNAYAFRNDLVLLIITSSWLVIFGTIFTIAYGWVIRSDDYNLVIDWCRKFMESESKNAKVARKNSAKIFYFNWKLCYGYGFSYALLPTIIGITTRTPPLPFTLPYLNPNTWTAFILNSFIQVSGIYIYDTMGTVFWAILGMHFYTTLSYIDELVDQIRALGQSILDKDKDEKNSSIEYKNRSLELKDFSEKINYFVDTYCSAIETFNMMSDILSVFLFLFELMCFANIFIGGIILLIEKEHYILAVTCIATAIWFYACCYVHEMLVDKLLEVSEAYYNLPWFYLTVKEKRMILMALNCCYVTSGYTAVNMHELTIERFSTVIQAAYSNVLVLKDLIVALN